ncbi:MAG TPA: alpha/beta fold hydrolase [Armatimonadota bacterium]|nr:alpha/beta fold hydrolase [Armatimonadota bacterium]
MSGASRITIPVRSSRRGRPALLPWFSLLIGLAALVASAAGCRADIRALMGPPKTIEVNGVTRLYYLEAPKPVQAGKRYSLVILLHGLGGDPISVADYTGFARLARKANFFLVCPLAEGDPTVWSVGLNTGLHDPTDVEFFSTLIDHLEKTLPVDPDRVFVAGHSSGAMMADRLASEISDKIAAIGVVAGTVGARDADGKLVVLHPPARPVSVIAFHGDHDPIMPYSTGDTWAYNANFFSAAQSIDFWVKADGCPAADRKVTKKPDVIEDDYPHGRDNTEVILYSVIGGDHWWPGDRADAAYIAPADEAIDATSLIWKFFQSHPRHAETNPAPNKPGPGPASVRLEK